jgi:hypothetical protein
LTTQGRGFVRLLESVKDGKVLWARRTRRLTRRIFFGINLDKVENPRVPFFNGEVGSLNFLFIRLSAAFSGAKLFASTFGREGAAFFDKYGFWF